MQPEFTGPEVQEDTEGWLEISRQAQVPDEALEYAQRAMHLSPEDPRVLASVQRSVFGTLDHDPFVAFLAETGKTYIVMLRDSRPIVVPKAWEQAEMFPPPRVTDGERALGMIWWMVLGLLPAGIGAVVLCPFMVVRGMSALNHEGADDREARLGWMAIIMAVAIGVLGGLFTLLLILHLIS